MIDLVFIHSERLDIVELLIEKGAKVNAKTKYNWTPLIYATRLGNLNIVKLLIEKGAEVNVKDNKNWTPLIHAARSGN